jgi:hypothetical protein
LLTKLSGQIASAAKGHFCSLFIALEKSESPSGAKQKKLKDLPS